eukprot:7100679-Alexandrium_andersonii.AAC.1
MCRAGEPPCPLTWGQLCAGGTLHGLVRASRQRPAGGATQLKVASWSVRWLVNPRHHRARAKRARIMNLINQGSLAALQETHWADADAG